MMSHNCPGPDRELDRSDRVCYAAPVGGVDWAAPNLLSNPEFETADEQGLRWPGRFTATPVGTATFRLDQEVFLVGKAALQGRRLGHRPAAVRCPAPSRSRAVSVLILSAIAAKASARRGNTAAWIRMWRSPERCSRQATRLRARDQLPVPRRGLGSGRPLCPGSGWGRTAGHNRQPEQPFPAADRGEYPLDPLAGRLPDSPVYSPPPTPEWALQKSRALSKWLEHLPCPGLPAVQSEHGGRKWSPIVADPQAPTIR